MDYRDNPQRLATHQTRWTTFTPPRWTKFAPPLTLASIPPSDGGQSINKILTKLSYANERSDMVRLAKAAGFVESDVPVKDVMFGVAPSSLRCGVDEDVSSLHDLVIFRKVDPENPFDLF